MIYCNHLMFGLLMIVSVTIATDYCNKDICEGEAVPSHIGCGNDGDFAPSCPVERSVVPMTDDVITLILQRHNTARMNIANGDVGGFSPAERMIEMSWDDELAYLAALKAKTCIPGHDYCRNTAAFRYVGQNIGITSSSADYVDAVTAINQSFDMWYNENVYCNMNQINELSDIVDAYGNTFGHFTQVIMANASKVGCAIVNYFADNSRNVLLVCNYSQNNVNTWPVYTIGVPCSGCKSGCSVSFPGLCNTNEVAELTGKPLIFEQLWE